MITDIWNAIPDTNSPVLMVIALVIATAMGICGVLMIREARRGSAEIRAKERAARAWSSTKQEDRR